MPTLDEITLASGSNRARQDVRPHWCEACREAHVWCDSCGSLSCRHAGNGRLGGPPDAEADNPERRGWTAERMPYGTTFVS
jgi:hypothetical protein